MNKIILLCLWIGKLPDYFKYHYQTCISNKNVDFLLITDQKIELKYSSNYKIINITLSELKERIDSSMNIDWHFSNNRNICSLKCGLGDIFYDEIKNYSYWGFHDIDTLFGDFNKFVIPYLEYYDIISFGVKNYHDRLSGPLMIIRNDEKYNKLYRRKFDEFVNKLYNYQIDSFDETEFNSIVKEDSEIKYKILYEVCNFLIEKSYPLYESIWSGSKLLIDDQEKLIHHFIDKNNISFQKIGNMIISSYKKELLDDFYFVTYLTENYEKIASVLLDSISKFSNRKCIVYTINYMSKLHFSQNEQFIFRRFDIEKGEIDKQGRDFSVISSKPLILSDVIDFIPNGNFIFLDTDIYVNVNIDNISKYFKELENYPLINSHIHDKLLANDILDSKEWISPLDILSEVSGIPIIIFPRRKTNVILFNQNCKWFFEEQMELYKKYKDTRPGIFRLHDEDSANIILSKYNFSKCLPVIDMEESSYIDMNKFSSYSYNLSNNISTHVVLPSNKNEVFIFHGFKDSTFVNEINKEHLPNVIEHDRISISYENNTLFFKKYGFLADKKISPIVNFKIKKLDGQIIFELNNQDIYRYWLFYVSNLYLDDKYYLIQIENDSNDIIFNKIIKIK
jgi:hypothetical protein